LSQIVVVEKKLEELDALLVILNERIQNVGRESNVTPPLQDILNHLMVCFDKLNNEACRVV
jgi:hypothetical protein